MRRNNTFSFSFAAVLSFLLARIVCATNVGGYISTNTTWTLANSPYIITSDIHVCGTSNPVLTVEPGVVIKANAGKYLRIGDDCPNPGGISAVGTSSSPIIFQGNTATPTAGYWVGLRLAGGALSSSVIAFATIQSATNGIYLDWASPGIHNVLFDKNTIGLRTSGGSHPAMYANNFTGNTSGIVNVEPASGTTTSTLAWFNSADGPSGSGPGTGQSVSTGVVYEPWLTSIANNSNYISSAVIRNKIFNPQIQSVWTFNYVTNTSQNWTMTIKNSSGNTVRTLTGAGSNGAVVWDGKDDSGATQSNGNFTYQFDSASAASATGKITIDSTKQFTMSALSLTYSYFSPNNDSIQETTTVSATTNYDDVGWTLNVKDSSNAVVRTITGTGPPLTVVWDGRDNGGAIQPDGVYTLEFIGTEGTSTITQSVSATLDATFATTSILYPTANQTLSNVYQSGATDVDIIGTANDTNLSSWQLDRGTGSNPSSWTTIKTGTTTVVGASLGTWATSGVSNNTYTLRLQVWDRAGNHTEVRCTVTVANFSMSKAGSQFNSGTGGTMTYTSVVPFTLIQRLVIRDEDGNEVRELFNGSRNAGTYTDIWDGKGSLGATVPDGAYFYTADVGDGVHGMSWDLTNQFEAASWVGDYSTVGAWDPYNNSPLTFTYNFGQAGAVSFVISPTYISSPQGIPAGCDPPNVCILYHKYEESGTHTYSWAGVDSAGVFHPDVKGYSLGSNRAYFAQNAVVVYGTKPVISGSLVTVSPPVFMPGTGNQSVNFTLSTYQNQQATVTVTYMNQSSLSVLRTITANVSPGAVSIPFDGRADNNMWVAPGDYLVTATVVDSIGNRVSAQILTSIQY